jgi:hypothetical protein
VAKLCKPGRPPRLGRKASEVRFEIRLTNPERSRWQSAADKERLSLSEWLRAAAELAIARGSTR